jgi:UDP-N-acetylglucosamine diphosphorylase / glucose-1-phosphate thymidylyltransferase / UDP-N-acetylgalactosamine diphosphorylase / glucosamine-1-phosphate N-acetyltransferase / galactosamine-1-phosphate N-acetyltransferase
MIFLNEIAIRENLFPFTHTRHVAAIRLGILTIREKWELLGEEITYETNSGAISVPANIIPTKENYQQIIALCAASKTIVEDENIKIIKYPWHIFQHNSYGIKKDFELLTAHKKSQPISDTNKIINAEQIFIAEGATIEYAILNASTGPIYIDENATVQEGSMIRGSFYLGKNATVKMGAKIFEDTSIGHNCVIGGEIKNSVIFDSSNKAHDGYLGNSVIGSYCNIGAGTSNSNLKNTAGNISIQLAANIPTIYAGIKAGLFMGDYSKAAINTSFNTGTVVGVSCNIFGQQNLPKFINNFTWGNVDYNFDKAIQHINNWMALKNETLSKNQIEILEYLYSQKNK